jgi:hypothetical protein
MKFKEISKITEQIYQQIDVLIKLYKEAPVTNVLFEIKRCLKQIEANFNSLASSSIVRHELIDKQIKKEIFEGRLHDEYHDATEKVQVDIDNLISSLKTGLNRLPIIFEKMIIEKNRRGISVGTFGKWSNSLVANQQSIQSWFPYDLIQSVQKIDKEVVEIYRDKIEHGGTANNSGLGTVIHEDFIGLRNVHSPLAWSPDLVYANDRKIVGGKTHWTKIQDSENSRIYYYYVHFSLYSDVKDGYHMSPEKPIGQVYHSIPEHFEKYGSHFHFFLSPAAYSRNPSLKVTNTQDLSLSLPDPFESTKATLQIVLDFLCWCVSYN